MKAITIRQPWASLIVHGIKDVENRSWTCPKKYIGKRILIHASTKSDKEPYMIFNDSQADAVDNIIMDVCQFYGQTGCIIGSVEIVDCIQNHASIWAEKDVWNWVLANPVQFEKPIPCKGKLSFWEYIPETNKERYDDSERIVMSVPRAYRNKKKEIQAALKFRIEETEKINLGITPYIDDEYWCETCGSHSHKCHPDSDYCFICNTDNWKAEDGVDVGI